MNDLIYEREEYLQPKAHEQSTQLYWRCAYENGQSTVELLDNWDTPTCSSYDGRTGENVFHVLSNSAKLIDINSEQYVPNLVRRLVSIGLDINKISAKQVAPIHLACGKWNEQLIKDLAQNGANLDAIADNAGRTPLIILLDMVNFMDFKKIKSKLQLLLDLKANPNQIITDQDSGRRYTLLSVMKSYKFYNKDEKSGMIELIDFIEQACVNREKEDINSAMMGIKKAKDISPRKNKI